MAIINIACILLYFCATGYTVGHIVSRNNINKNLQNILCFIPIALHSIILVTTLTAPQGMQVNLFNMFSLAAFLVCALLLIYNLNKQMSLIAVLALPTSALSVTFAYFYSNEQLLNFQSPRVMLHVSSSILAYAILALATLQAIQLAVIEKRLKSTPSEMNPLFPPLDTVENFLFNLIWFGFALLTLSLLSSLWLPSGTLQAQPLHKPIFSVVSWLIYAWLLWGRHQRGWRGKKAIKLSIAGFSLLLIAYFGTKFVLEFIL